jgi:ectoine hydroxylase-related dioxygenase (phytanoyl-CoA dioxygenase family)
MVNSDRLEELDHVGLTVVAGALDGDTVAILRDELMAAREAVIQARPDAFDKGMVHNCMVYGSTMAGILDLHIMNAYVRSQLGDTCILYAYQSSSLAPHGGSNYGRRIHRDSPRFIPDYPTNLGVILALDAFTTENGATHFVPGSHRWEDLPSEEVFIDNQRRALCKAGDMILFHARLAHRSGVNQTDMFRHALTLNVCRSFMRQRFDFPRLLPPELVETLGADGKRLVGMNVRVPTSLDEFYLPEGQRLYKANQG